MRKTCMVMLSGPPRLFAGVHQSVADFSGGLACNRALNLAFGEQTPQTIGAEQQHISGLEGYGLCGQSGVMLTPAPSAAVRIWRWDEIRPPLRGGRRFRLAGSRKSDRA